MRLDVLLSRLCLFKTRSQAARACDEGRVRLNGRPAKAAVEVRPGDRIRFTDRFARWEDEVDVVAIPDGSVSRAAAREYYHLAERRPLDGPWDAPTARPDPDPAGPSASREGGTRG